MINCLILAMDNVKLANHMHKNSLWNFEEKKKKSLILYTCIFSSVWKKGKWFLNLVSYQHPSFVLIPYTDSPAGHVIPYSHACLMFVVYMPDVCFDTHPR